MPIVPIIVPLSDLTPVATEWLWPGWLAAGHLHVLDGDPGVGKSMLTADLAARQTAGRPWPDGAASAGPGTVMLLNAEDDAAGTMRSRLAAADADMSRVLVWNPASGEAGPLLPQGVPQLADIARQRRPRLIVLDPVSAFLDRRVNFNSDPAIRRALAPLAALALDEHCAVLLVRHLSKQSGGRPLYRGLGSIGLIAACRIAWLAAHDPKDPSQSVLSSTKNNLTAPPSSLAYRVTCGGTFVTCPEPPSAPDTASREPSPTVAASFPTCHESKDLPRQGENLAATPAPRLDWLGPIETTAAELLGSRAKSEPARHRARRFLAGLLASGPLRANDVRVAARTQGLHMKTVRRAARELGVDFRQIGNHIIGQSVFWLMPGQVVPKEALDPNGIDEWLERLDNPRGGELPNVP